MARIQKKAVRWDTPTDQSVVKHRLYIVPESGDLDYNSPHADIDMPETEYGLPGDFTFADEGNYRIGLTAMDDAGNESDMVEIVSFFDLVPPVAPAGLCIVDI